MEYSWGYAAARAPLPNTYQRRPPPPSPSTLGPRDRRQRQDEGLEGAAEPAEQDETAKDKRKASGGQKQKEQDQGQEHDHQQQRPLDPHFYPSFLRPSRPTRSNSTSQVTASKRRPRILGHKRTSSSSSRSQSSNETVLQHFQLEGGPSAPHAGGSAVTSTSERMSASASAKYYQTKQLPATPRPDDTHDSHTTTSASNKGDDSSSSSNNNNKRTAAPSQTAKKSSSASEPPSARSPSSATSPRLPFTFSFPISGSEASPLATGLYGRPPPAQHPVQADSAIPDRRLQQQHAAMVSDYTLYSGKLPLAGGISSSFSIPSSSSTAAAATAAANRAESMSTASGATTHSGRTMYSSEPPHSATADNHQRRPFVVRNGRSYIADPTLHYPLPVDLAELHRQSLRTLLLFQLFGGPVCSPVFANRPPTRVLEVGCGSAFWSMMCHRYYARHGHTNISFTGLDIAPLAPGSSGSGSGAAPGAGGDGAGSNRPPFDPLPDKDMKWRFVQHDMRRLPWPFADGEFDLVMVKDMALATPLTMQQTLVDEFVRLLRPGGVLEIWESDYTLRMLRAHVPGGAQMSSSASSPQKMGMTATTATEEQEDGGGGDDSSGEGEDSDSSEEDEHEAAANLGAYLITAHTPLSAPTNNFLVEYNGWVAKAMEARSLSAVPCTVIGSLLLQEVDALTGLGSKRLAVPLSEVRWEREGVGGVVTKDGKSYIETKAYRGVGGKRATDAAAGRPLGAGQAAVRRTALMTVVLQIQSLEAVLREVSGKSQDEWDGWCGKMMNDLVKENGTTWGECLEIGAWWARKKA